jgi:autotransporter passenger strand-loop-strand repeat protein
MSFTRIVSGGIIADNETVTDGTQMVSSGGMTNNTTISYLGMQNIAANGMASNTTINSGGYQHILSGGIAKTTTINYGGYQTVSPNGIATDTTINFGATQYVSAGGAAIRNTINSAGSQHISSGGIADSTTVNNGGNQDISSGGRATTTVIDAGGYQTINSGGTATNTTILAGGRQVIASGGTASIVDQQAGGIIITNTGATIIDGTNRRSDGYCRFSIINGIASNFLINSGGYFHLLNGHFAINTMINGGSQYIASGGMADSTIINEEGYQIISSGGIATSTTINSGGDQTIFSGGIATSTTINSGGDQTIFSGGMATSTTIFSGGRQLITSGGTASIIDQQAGGVIITNTGATLTDGTNRRSDGHSIFSIVNGTANNFLLESDGQLIVSSGHSAINTMINSGGYQQINSGGTANSTTINSEGSQVVSGSATNVTINADGLQEVFGTATDTIVNSQGNQRIYSGGTASSVTINSGGIQHVENAGIATDTTINSGGSIYVSSGGNLSGELTVNGGTVVTDTIVNMSNASDRIYLNGNTNLTGATLSLTGGGNLFIHGINNIAGDLTVNSDGFLNFNLETFSLPNTVAMLTDFTDVSVSTFNLTTDSSNNAAGSYALADNVAAFDNIITIYDGLEELGDLSLTNLVLGTDQIVYTLSIVSDMLNFNIDIDDVAPEIPTGLTDSVNDNDAELDWDDAGDNLSGVKEYIVEYSVNSNFSGAISETVIASELDLSGLNDNDYHWRVKTIDNVGNESDWSAVNIFTIDTPDTQAPSLPSNLTQQVNGSDATLDWNDSTDNKSGLKEYTVEYSVNPDFSGAIIQTVIVSELELNGLADDIYYWRVNAIDNTANESEWSIGSNIIVDTTAPSIPNGLTDTVTGENTTLDWSDANDNVSGVKEYLVTYADNAGFTNTTEQAVIDSELDLNALPGGIYYWRVKAVDNADNSSDWSAIDSFRMDNSFASAILIDISVPYSGSDYVGLGDICDYYKFISNGNGEFDFGLTGLSSKIKGSIIHYDAARDRYKRIASIKTDKNTGLTAVHDVLLRDGETYYAVIESVDKGKGKYNTDYTLDIDGEYFPNATNDNSWQTAQVLTDTPVDGWVGFGDNSDWYQFDLTSAGTVDLKLSNLQSDANMNLYYYDDNKNKLKRVGKAKLKGTADELISELVDAGTYYAEVIPGKKVNNASYNLDLDIASV